MSTAPRPQKKAKGNRGLKTGSIFKEEERDARGRVTRTFYTIRKRYTDAQGRRREKKRTADSYADALEFKQEIEREIKEELAAPRLPKAPPEKTFGDLADYYDESYLIPPVYNGGAKVAGLRSYRSGKSNLKTLRAYFDARRSLRRVTHEDVRRFKEWLLGAPVVFRKKVKGEDDELRVIETERPRGIVSVHRHLQMLRRMFSVAVSKGWMERNPFAGGESPLISTAEEEERMIILSRDEEARLLAALGEWPEARTAVVIAIETALRDGEQFKLTRRMVNLDAGLLTVESWKGKRRKVRHVPVNERARAEFVRLLAAAEPDMDARVFPHVSERRAFEAARKAAGLDGLRWHDLRHTAITRMLAATRDGAQVMKVSGHDNWKTFLRYVTINKELAREFSAMMDVHRGAGETRKDEGPRTND
jgi:integrase